MESKMSVFRILFSITVMFIGSALSQVTSQNYDCGSTSSQTPVPPFFLPFGPASGDGQLPPSDNGGVKVELNTRFPFFTEAYKNIYVNTNGIVSFESFFPTLTPARPPLRGSARQPMLAPYWADIDTTVNNGRVYLRQSTSTSDRQTASNLVLNYMDDDVRREMQSYAATSTFIVTWRNVTFRGGNCRTPVNTFQLVMSTNGRHSFVTYMYGDMTWTTGRTDGGNAVGLGGTPALVGYASGGTDNNYYVPSSLTTAIRDIENVASNTARSGMWSFRLDTNSVQNWGCNIGGYLTTIDGAGPALGGKPFYLSGPCFHGFNVMKCKIGDTVVEGVRVSSGVKCVPPTSPRSVEVPVLLSIDGGRTYPFKTSYYYGYDDPKYLVEQENLEEWETANHRGVITWDTSTLDAAYVKVEFYVILIPVFGLPNVTAPIAEMDTRNNPGRLELPLGLPQITKMPTLTSYSLLKIYDFYKANQPDTRTTLWNKPQWSHWFFYQYLIELIYRQRTNYPVEMTDEATGIWNDIRKYVGNVSPQRQAIADFIVRGGLDDWQTPYFNALCKQWETTQQQDPTDFSSLKPVPCTQRQAEGDMDFIPYSDCRRGKGCSYRPEAAYCALDKTPSSNGHGQLACYDRSGNLLTRGGTVSAGAAQKYFQSDWFLQAFDDTRGHAHCCRFTSNCNTYNRYRPTGNCAGYSTQAGPTTIGPVTRGLKLSPDRGMMLGGNQVLLELTSSQLSSSNQVKCFFGNNSIVGSVTFDRKVRCIAPLSLTLGKVKVTVSTDNGNTILPYSAYYTYMMKAPDFEVKLVDEESWEIATHKGVIEWNTTSLPASVIRVEFDVIFPVGFSPTSGAITQETVILASADTRRTPGRAELPLGLPLITKMPTLTSYGPIRIFDMYKERQPDTRVTLWSRPQWSLWFYHQYLIELIYRKKRNIRVEMTQEATDTWNQIRQYVQNVNPTREDIAAFIARGGLDPYRVPFYEGFCKSWARADSQNPPDFSRLSPVPCTSAQASNDGNYLPDPDCVPGRGCLYRPQAQTCFVSRVPSINNHGQRACYDSSGNLLKTGGTVSAGSAQRYFPTAWFTNAFFDARGLAHCCRFSQTCATYSQNRPTGDCAGYLSFTTRGSQQPSGTTASPSALKAVPQMGPVVGGNPVLLTYGGRFDSNSQFVCRFNKTSVPGQLIQNQQVKCIAPINSMLGKVDIALSTDGGRNYLPDKAPYVYVMRDPQFTMERVDLVSWDRANVEATVRWKDFNPNSINVDFVAYMPALVPTDPPDQLVTPILIRQPVNSPKGEVKLPIGLPLIREMPLATTFGSIRIYDSSQTQKATRTTLYTEPAWSLWFLNHYLTELIYRKRSGSQIQMTLEADNFWQTGLEALTHDLQPDRAAIADFIANGGLDSYRTNRFTTQYCNNWYISEKANPANFADLPAAPCTPEEAGKDGRYVQDPDCNLLSGCPYRTNATQCFLLGQPTAMMHGQRVCYDRQGQLLTPGGTVSAGGAQRYFPTSWYLNLFFDTRGHDHCCEFGNACYRYAEMRPTNSCTGYSGPGTPGNGDLNSTLSSLIGMLLAGGATGVIIAVIIVCFGLPSAADKQKKSRSVSKPNPEKKRKKEINARITKAKNVHRNAVTGYPENDYVEPMYSPQPAQNRNSRDVRRSNTSSTEYTNIRDSYNDKRSSRASEQLASQETVYSDARYSNNLKNNRNRDSQLSDPASVRSSNSKRSSNSRRSYQQPMHERRISEESGDSRQHGGSSRYGRNSEISESGVQPPSPSYGYGHPAGSTNIMF